MRKKNFVRIFAWIALVAFLAVSLFTIVPFRADAASAQERLNKARQQQQEINKKLNDTQSKKKQEQQKKSQIDADVAAIQKEIDALDAQIEQINDRIDEKTEELAVAHEMSSKQFESYKNRVKLIVEKGSITYLEVLLNANSLEDFFVRMDVVEKIASYDNQLLTELKENEQLVEALKIEIENERSAVMSIMEDSLEKKRVLASKQAASKKMLDELALAEKTLTKELKEAKEAEEQAHNEIYNIVSGDNSRYTGGKFLWPTTNSYVITSPYSMRVHPTLGVYKQHTGIDIGASYGTNVLAAAAGTVIIAGWNNAYGNYVVINHGGGVTTLYGHNSKLTVSKGQKVTRGQTIAKVGSTGYSTGPHIHFEVQVNGKPVNPMSYLK